MTLIEYRGLSQGLVLSPFLYNLLSLDRFMSSGCIFLQYADDIVVYSSYLVVQTACSSISVCFLLLGLMTT
jgi:hypothetical protein